MSSDEIDEFAEFRNDSEIQANKNQKAIYYLSAFFTVSVPFYLYVSIYDLNLATSLPVYGLVTLAAGFVLTYAYHNVNVATRKRLLIRRDRDVNISDYATNARQGEKKGQYLQRKRDETTALTSRESLAYSLMYNNALFLTLSVLLGFYFFRNAPAVYNYILSTGLSAGLLSFLSTGSA